jgi:hypothetical protein
MAKRKQQSIPSLVFNQLKQAFNSQEFQIQNFWLGNLRYVFFISLLAMLYIANSRYAERGLREITNIQEELKEKRWHYLTTKSKLMDKSKQTEVAKEVKRLGLEELREPPQKIVVPKK